MCPLIVAWGAWRTVKQAKWPLALRIGTALSVVGVLSHRHNHFRVQMCHNISASEKHLFFKSFISRLNFVGEDGLIAPANYTNGFSRALPKTPLQT